MNAPQAARQIAAECLAMRSRRLARSVSRAFDEALRPAGVSAAQLGLLVVIERRGPVSPAAVGRFLDIEKSTLSRNLRRLGEAGLVHVEAEAQGRRLTLTARGRKALEQAHPLWRSAQRRARGILGDDLVAALARSDR